MIRTEDFWNDIKNELQKTMHAISYEVFIEKLEPVCFMDDTFVLSAPSNISKKKIDEKYSDIIKGIANSINSFIKNIEIIVKEDEENYIKKRSVSIPELGLIVDDEKKVVQKKTPFKEDYTFDFFVEGKSNQFALAAAKTVAQTPGVKFNPLFIYSGVGLGKTHLLHAIGNYLFKNSPHLRVVYASSETLLNEFVASINNSHEEKNKFNEKYRFCDVLMIDDIQFLSGKGGSQEFVFHVFNDLYQANKQIIITSDKSPKEIVNFEERLRSRFSWGLSLDIQPPDLETKIAILKQKAAKHKFNLSNEVAMFIAENSPANIREMEGMLTNLFFYSSLNNKPIVTKELAAEAISTLFEEKKSVIDASDIINTVCNYYEITPFDIFGKKKTKNVVEPRMVAIYLITEILSLPLASIGQIFGGRDHTTIIHARNKIAEDIKTDTRLRIIVVNLKNKLLNR